MLIGSKSEKYFTINNITHSRYIEFCPIEDMLTIRRNMRSDQLFRATFEGTFEDVSSIVLDIEHKLLPLSAPFDVNP